MAEDMTKALDDLPALLAGLAGSAALAGWDTRLITPPSLSRSSWSRRPASLCSVPQARRASRAGGKESGRR